MSTRKDGEAWFNEADGGVFGFGEESDGIAS
jgi:hypothetical protein